MSSTDKHAEIDFQKLLEIEIAEEQHFLEAHQKRVAFYSSILSALTAATIAGAMKASESYQFFLLISGPILIFNISHIAKTGTFRIYQRFIEAITMRAKLETVIGLTKPISEYTNDALYWSQEPIVASRHLESRTSYECSDEFIKDRKKSGYHKSSLMLFKTFQAVGMLIFILLIYSSFKC